MLRGSPNRRDEEKIVSALDRINRELKRLNKLHGKHPHFNERKRRQLKNQRGLNKQVNPYVLGGLEFQATSPPGLGRLVSLPFYPVNVNADVTTSAGTNTDSRINPVCIYSIGNTTANLGTSMTMRTPEVSWATLRIVGFEAEYRTNSAQNQSSPTLLVDNLRVGGSTNLFTHENASDVAFYDTNKEYYAGLRDYPLLVSPNTTEVTVCAVSGTATGDTVTFSLALVCEVLYDDEYGVHLPGPYARGASMVRETKKVFKQ